MKHKVTAVFDIGKTNKKFFLLDKNYQEVYREYTSFEEIKDEDGYPAENLEALEKWIKTLLYNLTSSDKFKVQAVNFSTYGSSLVHIGQRGIPLTPLYNYTKPLDETLIQSFQKKHGPGDEFSRITGSINFGMVCTGMQLYWLKYAKPEIFKKIKYSLHLPQYLSYIFTGIPLGEYTSIGCHTALWDYDNNSYHDWVYKEKIHKILPPIVSAHTSINTVFNNERINFGVGIHDSSAALLPYLKFSKKSFILLSTGTCNVTLNPSFRENTLTKKEVLQSCINYMRIDGKPVRATRLFLGNEYKYQVQQLSKIYNVKKDYHKKVEFDPALYQNILKNYSPTFKWIGITDENAPKRTKFNHQSYEAAYHQLMVELVMVQVKSIKVALGKAEIKTLFVNGGFIDNVVFIGLLSLYLPKMNIQLSNCSIGSALGAAMIVSNIKSYPRFFTKQYKAQ